MKRTIGAGIAAALVLAFFSCATEKPKDTKRFLDFDRLMSAEESTYLPFVVDDRRIQEIKELFAKDNLPMRPYRIDFSAKMTIPKDVKYREASAALNQKIVADFFNALKPPVKLAAIQENKYFICGAYLTALLKKSGLLSQLNYTKVIGPFNYFKRQDVLLECTIREDSIPRIFSLLRNLLYSDGAITVRKLTAQELDWYWVSSSYDIEEPIFVFENSRHKIMIHFTPEGQIFFLELFDTLNWKVRNAN